MPRLTTDPETRQSLLVRLRDSRDEQAWAEFSQLYEPVIYRLASQRGMQDADAREIVQEVLMSVSKSINDFDLAATGSFRGWLSRITRNTTVDHFRRRTRASGGQLVPLAEVSDLEDSRLAEDFDQQHRRQLFLWAGGIVRQQVGESTWIAFWDTAVAEKPVAQVAANLSISEGAVYIARCRVLKKIREIVHRRELE